MHIFILEFCRNSAHFYFLLDTKRKRKPTFLFGRRQWVDVYGELDYRRVVSIIQANTKEQAEEE
jgi:hypothetical protein